MKSPKISVLIPLYNRKHCITQCVDSVLKQTFKDYEILIRDDCSTDGSFDFVKKKYSKQISSGKIKLFRNKKPAGEFVTEQNLFQDSAGKYVAVLHNDDLYLPHALQHLYEVAEKFHADVVHSTMLYNSPPDGVINENTQFQLICNDMQPIKDIQIIPESPELRFQKVIMNPNGMYGDIQYGFFNADFIRSNELLGKYFGNAHSGSDVFSNFTLAWIMLAKVVVETPVPSYIRRDAPDSGTNVKILPMKTVENFIGKIIKSVGFIDELISQIKFLKDNEDIVKYHVLSRMFLLQGGLYIRHKGCYQHGITLEMHKTVLKTFEKYCGRDVAYYMTWLFHYAHYAPFDIRTTFLFNPPGYTFREYESIAA